MKSFKLLKREFLIRLMTVLGFGGMVGFCISSCQQDKPNQDNQMNQESANDDSVESEQTVTESNKAVDDPKAQNDDNQPDQESNNENDSMQTVTESDAPDDINTEQEEQQQQNDLVQMYKSPKKYGPISPPYVPERPNPLDVKKELSALYQKMQSICHPEKGNLNVVFTITPTGQVTDVKSKDGTLKGTEREICILKELSKYTFSSKGDRNIPVTYRFNFK